MKECLGISEVGFAAYFGLFLIIAVIAVNIFFNIMLIKKVKSAYYWIGILFVYLIAGVFALLLRQNIEEKHSLLLCANEPINIIAGILKPVVLVCEVAFFFILISFICVGSYKIFNQIFAAKNSEEGKNNNIENNGKSGDSGNS